MALGSVAGTAVVRIVGDETHAVGAMRRFNQRMEASERKFNKDFGAVAATAKQGAFAIVAATATAGYAIHQMNQELDRLRVSERRLDAQSKLAGVSLQELAESASDVRREFQTSNRQANEMVTVVSKLTTKAGDVSQTTEAIRAFINVGAAQGLSIEDTLASVYQAILGIDEGTDKLFQKNPSAIYAEFADRIGTTAGKLDDQQKAQALVEEATRSYLAVGDQYKDFLDEAAGKQQIVNSRLEDAAAAFAKAYEPARISILDEVAGGIERIGTAAEDNQALVENFIRLIGDELGLVARAALALRHFPRADLVLEEWRNQGLAAEERMRGPLYADEETDVGLVPRSIPGITVTVESKATRDRKAREKAEKEAKEAREKAEEELAKARRALADQLRLGPIGVPEGPEDIFGRRFEDGAWQGGRPDWLTGTDRTLPALPPSVRRASTEREEALRRRMREEGFRLREALAPTDEEMADHAEDQLDRIQARVERWSDAFFDAMLHAAEGAENVAEALEMIGKAGAQALGRELMSAGITRLSAALTAKQAGAVAENRALSQGASAADAASKGAAAAATAASGGTLGAVLVGAGLAAQLAGALLGREGEDQQYRAHLRALREARRDQVNVTVVLPDRPINTRDPEWQETIAGTITDAAGSRRAGIRRGTRGELLIGAGT